MQIRVIGYFRHYWSTRFFIDEKELLSQMPKGLQLDVLYSLRADALHQVPLFATLGRNFVDDLILHMSAQACAKHDFVIRAGEIARELYLVSKGVLDVIVPDNWSIICTISDGATHSTLFAQVTHVPQQQKDILSNLKSTIHFFPYMQSGHVFLLLGSCAEKSER